MRGKPLIAPYEYALPRYEYALPRLFTADCRLRSESALRVTGYCTLRVRWVGRDTRPGLLAFLFVFVTHSAQCASSRLLRPTIAPYRVIDPVQPTATTTEPEPKRQAMGSGRPLFIKVWQYPD